MNLIFDDNDHMYVADRDNKRVVVAYNGEYEKSYDLNGFSPYTIAWDARKENIFIGGNGTWKICKLCLADGKVTTICGSGAKPTKDTYTDGTEGPLTATLGNISGIVADENGYVWFNDILGFTFRVLIPGPEGDYSKGLVKTVAGTPFSSNYADGDGLTEAKFAAQGMLARDSGGNFYLSDGNKNHIRKVAPVK